MSADKSGAGNGRSLCHASIALAVGGIVVLAGGIAIGFGLYGTMSTWVWGLVTTAMTAMGVLRIASAALTLRVARRLSPRRT